HPWFWFWSRSLVLVLVQEPGSGSERPALCVQDGYIDFVEYIAAISLLLKGEINQKLKWYFKLFDQDGNGKIDKDELETIFTAIQDITRNRDIDPEEIVTLIYEKIDVKGEGELTLEEFIEGAKEHPDIMDMLKNLMDLTPVLEIIVKGREPAIEN
uniref:Guanylate cyclase activator 1d n=1 Tax=Fundulus heteroclitus TaxID=8078 RepID=A0A3Q2QB24_FUNHE